MAPKRAKPKKAKTKRISPIVAANPRDILTSMDLTLPNILKLIDQIERACAEIRAAIYSQRFGRRHADADGEE
jgi:hypothetical protein